MTEQPQAPPPEYPWMAVAKEAAERADQLRDEIHGDNVEKDFVLPFEVRLQVVLAIMQLESLAAIVGIELQRFQQTAQAVMAQRLVKPRGGENLEGGRPK